MEKILDMMRAWPPFGQGVFLLLVIGMLLQFASSAIHSSVALVRGWPPPSACSCNDDNEATDET